MNDFELLKLSDNLILTKDFRVFDLTKRIFVNSDDGLDIKISNTKKLSFKKAVKEGLKFFDGDPTELILNSELRNDYKEEFIDTWHFYHHKHLPLSDFIELTTIDTLKNYDNIKNFYVDEKGVYSLVSDKYLKMMTSNERKFCYIKLNKKMHTVYYTSIYEKMKEL